MFFPVLSVYYLSILVYTRSKSQWMSCTIYSYIILMIKINHMLLYLQGYYYFAIIEDFVIRFLWIPQYLLTRNNILSTEMAISLISPLEVFR